MISKKESTRFTKQQLQKSEKLQKPFGFCCDEKLQDINTKYDQRKPPFISSLTNVVLDSGGPDLKFRVKDTFVIQSSSTAAGGTIKSSSTHKVHLKSGTTHVSACKWSHGPINWYLEDEIALAQKILIRKMQKKRREEDKIKVLFTKKSKSQKYKL